MKCSICDGPLEEISVKELLLLPGCSKNKKHYEYSNLYRCTSHNVLTNYGEFYNPNYFIFVDSNFYLLVWKRKDLLYIFKYKDQKNNFLPIMSIELPIQHLNSNRIETILNYN